MRSPVLAALMVAAIGMGCGSEGDAEPDTDGQASGGGTGGGAGIAGGGAGGAGLGGADGGRSGGAAGTGDSGSGGAAVAGASGNCPVEPVIAVPTTPTLGLIDEWTFEGQEDRIVVEKDHRHDGVLHRAGWRPGRFGNALKLYGQAESYAEVPSFGDALGASFTISAWIQTTDKYTVNNEQSIVKKGDGGAGSFELWTDTNGTFRFTSTELGDFASQVNVMDCGPTGSVSCPWHHLAVAYDGSLVTLYVDGVSASATAASGSMSNTTGTLYFGADSYWGLIDQVRIFDRALAVKDISVLYAEGKYTPTVVADTGTIVAKVDAGTTTDGIDDFSADRAFAAGSWGYVDGGTSSTTIFAENTYSIYDLNYMFKSRRESSGPLTYRFTVPNGTYEVKLYFIEADLGEAQGRVLNVALEGKPVLSNYSILADAKELRTGVRKDFAGIVVSDGELSIDLVPVANKVSIAGITVQAEDGSAVPAPAPCTPLAPLYQEPNNGKLRDSSSIYNRHTATWMHFGLDQQWDDSYSDDSFGAAEMSNQGRGPWTALGTPTGRSPNDFGPVVVYDSANDKYHLFSGSFYKGIRHYTSLDDTLTSWKLEGLNVVPGSGGAEWDPAVWKVGDTWYMVTTLSLYESSDLFTWVKSPHADQWPRNGAQNENATVFYFHGYWWFTADTTNHFWRSPTGYSDWTDTGPTRMTGEGGERLRDQGYWPGNFQRYTFGHDAIVQDGRCFLTYDVKYEVLSSYSGHESRIVNQVLECKYIDGTLYMDANQPFGFNLVASQRGY